MPKSLCAEFAEELVKKYREDPNSSRAIELAKAAAQLLAADREAQGLAEMVITFKDAIPDFLKSIEEAGIRARAKIREEERAESDAQKAREKGPELSPEERLARAEGIIERRIAVSVAECLIGQATKYERFAVLGHELDVYGKEAPGTITAPAPDDDRAKISHRAMELRKQAADVLIRAGLDQAEVHTLVIAGKL